MVDGICIRRHTFILIPITLKYFPTSVNVYSEVIIIRVFLWRRHEAISMEIRLRPWTESHGAAARPGGKQSGRIGHGLSLLSGQSWYPLYLIY